MPYDPTSRDFTPIRLVRDLIARSTTFQTWTGTADTTAALLRVHYEIVTAPKNETMPFAIVGLEEGSQTSEFRALADHEIRGMISARFLAEVITTEDLDEQLFKFADNVIVIREEMILDAPVHGVRITSAAISEKPMLSPIEDRQSRGPYAFLKLLIGYWD